MIHETRIQTDPALIESILQRGLDPSLPVQREDFLQVIADAEAIDAAGFRSLPPAIAGMGQQFGEIGGTLMMPAAVGYRWLLRLLETSSVMLEESAVSDTLATLVRRLVPVLQQVVEFEAILSRSARSLSGEPRESAPEEPPLLDAWLERWQIFPVLASLTTLTLVHWIRAIEEMILALEHDHAVLAERLTGSSTPLTVRSIAGDAGDPHLGGRSVMILTFADETRVVFKPKDLAITDVFRALIDRINDAGFSTPLRAQRAIVRPTYTWEEYVSHHTCGNEEQIRRFYHRMGGWIRLLQVVEGRDFWLDNLIAAGEYPVFIDLETIMQPRRRGTAMPAAAERAQERLDASPLITNIVAMQAPIGPGVAAEDLGCFASPRDYLSPFQATEIRGARSHGGSRDGYRTWTHPEHAPVLDGHPVPAEARYEAIEAGYREMAQTIDVLTPTLLAPGGLVDQLSAHPVRTIFRDTWTCIKIIHRSTAPPLLGHYARRRQFLERMDRDAIDDRVRTGPVIAAEVEALLALDVPFFSAFGDDDAIHPPNGTPIASFFDETARDRVMANLRTFSPKRLEEDIAILRTSFWTTHQGTPAIPASKRSRTPIDERSPLQAAHHIACGIAEARLASDEDGSSSWIALAYHPTADIESWAPLGTDLLSGRAGLVTCFIDQWRSSGEDHWRDLAIESANDIATSIQQVIAPLGSEQTRAAQEAPLLVGAFTGLGGMLASLKLAATSFDDMALDGVWHDVLTGIDWPSALQRTTNDVYGGAVGLALALTARPEWVDQLPSDLYTTLAAIALGSDDVAPLAYPPAATAKLAALPGERVARLLVRSRLGVDRETLQDAIAAAVETATRPGDLLGLIEMSSPDSPWWPHLTHLVSGAVEGHGALADRAVHIQPAELLLAMTRASGDDHWLERARSMTEGWIAGYNDHGSWFPNDLADDRFRLSSVRGLPAIASILRRVGGAPVIANPMTLDWRPWSHQ